MQKLTLSIVTQEKALLSAQVDAVTAPTSEGEVTILPDHAPLFSKLDMGELRYKSGKEEHSLVVSRGFLDVRPDNTVLVMVDSASLAREISLEKAQAAVKAAKETMDKTSDQRELMMAEASLKQAMLEVRIAHKTKKSTV